MADFPSLIDLSSLGTDGFVLNGSGALNFTGESVSSAGDINGDGFDDFLIGAPSNDAAAYNAGVVYVVFGKAGGFSAINLADLAAPDGFKIRGGAYDFAGYSVASAGDVNGDGLDDLIVGARGPLGGAGSEG